MGERENGIFIGSVVVWENKKENKRMSYLRERWEL